MTDTDYSAQLAAINDRFRKEECHGIPDSMMMTAGVAALPPAERHAVLTKVRTFTNFTADDDPYDEHEFGAFDHAGERFFWKIDYYAPGLETGSEDPADLGKTFRVLTVLLATEW
jgi:hypothetical protein